MQLPQTRRSMLVLLQMIGVGFFPLLPISDFCGSFSGYNYSLKLYDYIHANMFFQKCVFS